MSCEFCEIESIMKEPIVAKSNHSIAFMCAEPLKKGHMLIIPKRHVKEPYDLSAEELYDLIQMLKKAGDMLEKTYGVTATLSYMKHGTAKTVEHLHIHLIPGFVPIREALADYKFSPKARDKKTVEELTKVANKIKSSG